MSVEQEIANLTSATTALLAAVNERKTVLDAAVDTAGLSAADAGAQAAAAAVALSNAQAAASLAEGHAASASSVVQQDLSGVTAAALHRSPNPVTALFVYDTSKDSDGGAWTEKCQHTSWWNEDLCGKWLGARASEAAARAVAGATTGDYFQSSADGKFYKLNATSDVTEVFRGNKRDFPRLAAIVAEASSVTIYDLTEPGRPMWMRFVAGTPSENWWQSSSATSAALAAVNGVVCVGAATNGIRNVRFVEDRIDRIVTSTSFVTPAGGIATRNAAATTGGYATITLVNSNVNAVAMTVLSDAPVDPVTGLAVPTIAVATGGGVSVIKHNGTVVNSGPTNAFSHVCLLPQRYELVAASGSGESSHMFGSVGELQSGFTSKKTLNSLVAPFVNTAGNLQYKYVASGNSFITYSANKYLTLLRQNDYTTRGAAAYITNNYNTGHMVGDIRRTYLSDNVVGSVSGPELWGQLSTFNSQEEAVAAGYLFTGCSFDSATKSVVFTGGSASLGFPTSGFRSNASYRLAFNGTKTSGTIVFQQNYVTLSFLSFPAVALMVRGAGGLRLVTTDFVGAISSDSVREVVADHSYKASGASITGALTKSAVASAAELVAYSGFSNSNYLREPYSADLDFGTGEWSVGAWVNVPTTLPSANFPAVGSTITSSARSLIGGVTDNGNGTYTISSGGSVRFTFLLSSLENGAAYRVTTPNISGGSVSVDFCDVQSFSESSGDLVFVASRATYDNTFRFVDVVAATGSTATVSTPYLTKLAPALIADRAYSSGTNLRLGIGATGKLTATAYDGTTTHTVTTTAAYNTATWVKAEAVYKAGKLAILVNGQEVAATYGAPLLTLNNADAVLTIGNSYALDAPFPGSIALLKFSATVPTPEQSVWMYEQEKQLFRAGAKCCLRDSNALVDLTYDEATDKWIAASASNVSEWSGLVRTNVTPVPAGAYSKLAAGGGVVLQGRTTTSPGVDVTIPAYGLREELVKRSEAAAKLNAQGAVFDYVGGFTASTTSGSTAITDVSGLSYPTSAIGAQVTGAGIPAGTAVQAISGTTGYLSKPATATASNVQVSFTDFVLPVGYEARAVSVDGVIKQEGTTKAYTRLFDGFRETIRFAVAPDYQSWVQIQATRAQA